MVMETRGAITRRRGEATAAKLQENQNYGVGWVLE